MSPRRNLDSSKFHPSLARPASVPLPPEPGGGGGAHSPAGEGLEESQFRRIEKKLITLPTLCCTLYVLYITFFHISIYVYSCDFLYVQPQVFNFRMLQFYTTCWL